MRWILILLLFVGVAEGGLPKNFRTTDGSFKFSLVESPSDLGLRELHASGSAQFNEEELQAMLPYIGHPCVIVDLRKEFHDAEHEEALAYKYGLSYFHIEVVDHGIPDQEAVNKFIGFVHELPPNTWLHFHCAAGRGRTTMFLAMYDMMHNADHVSFRDILMRQYLLGGINLMKTRDEAAGMRLQFLRQFYEVMHNILTKDAVNVEGKLRIAIL